MASHGEKVAANDLTVYSYVSRSSLPDVMAHGLHSGESLLKHPKLLGSAAAGRGISAEKMRQDIEENLKSWKAYSSKGPNVNFATIPEDLELRDNHPTKVRDLVPVSINLSALLRDQPKTKLYGMELRPYDEYVKDPAAGRRHRYLTHGEVQRYVRQGGDVWRTYNASKAWDGTPLMCHTPPCIRRRATSIRSTFLWVRKRR